jgi:SAM-dependent methyltransferase
VNTALQRAVELLADPPSNPDVSRGYLDLLGSIPVDTPKNTGLIQAAWASPLGSMVYDRAQLLARRVMIGFQHPAEWLDIPQGGVALDVGSGPGNVTASLARAAGPDGLALGVDISEPMLARAVRAEAGPQVGFVRADAQRLPFRDESFDAVTSIAMLQLIPDPPVALAEMVRVLRPGARMAVMVPTAGPAGALLRMLPNGGAHFFTDDEIADVLEDLGLPRVRTKTFGSIQWVRGTRP